MGEATADIALVVVPFPAQGHLNQLLHLCRLVAAAAPDVCAHFVGSDIHNRQARTRLHGCDLRAFTNIRFHDFSLPPFFCLPPDPHSADRFPAHLQPAFETVSTVLRPHVARLIRSLAAASRRVVVIHDSLMSFAAEEAHKVPGCESYVFHSVSAFALLLFQWESRGVLTEMAWKHFPAVGSAAATSSVGCFTKEFVRFIRGQHGLTSLDKGRIFNTCTTVEQRFIDLMKREPFLENKQLFNIGPLNPVVQYSVGDQKQTRRHECLDWLNAQPAGSVLYVSFGTSSTMCCRQIRDLAEGLRLSKQRFLWVLRDADRGDIFDDGKTSQPKSVRSHKGGDTNECWEKKEKMRELCSAASEGGRLGYVLTSGWAPQLEILTHPSTGGFLSHCGWNSCMESITAGVAMVAWPMHSDQPRNAIMVTDLLKIGVPVLCRWTPRRGKAEDDVVPSVQVEGAVRRLMVSDEGKAIRSRAAELGRQVRRSAADGGCSREQLLAFLNHITRP